MHLYFKNNRLSMWSEQPIDAPMLLHVEKTLTPDEFEKIKNNHQTSLKDEEIVQTEPPSLTEEQKEDRKNLVEDLKKQADKAKTIVDLKNILNQILTTIE